MIRIWRDWLGGEHASRRELPPIVPVVLVHDERGWRSPRRFEALFNLDGDASKLSRYLPRFELVIDDIAGIEDQHLAARQLPPLAALALWVLRDGRSPERLLQHVAFWAPLFEVLAQSPGGTDAIDVILQYVGRTAGERSLTAAALATAVGKHSERSKQVIMDSIERLKEEGRIEGRIEGQHEHLLTTLRIKFGELESRHRDLVLSADDAALQRYSERLLTSDSLVAVFGDSLPSP